MPEVCGRYVAAALSVKKAKYSKLMIIATNGCSKYSNVVKFLHRNMFPWGSYYTSCRRRCHKFFFKLKYLLLYTMCLQSFKTTSIRHQTLEETTLLLRSQTLIYSSSKSISRVHIWYNVFQAFAKRRDLKKHVNGSRKFSLRYKIDATKLIDLLFCLE